MKYDGRAMYEINAPEPEIKPVTRPKIKWVGEVLAQSASKPRGKISPLLAEYMKRTEKDERKS